MVKFDLRRDKKSNGYNLAKLVSIESIKLALTQENNLNNIFDKLGSNIGDLITEILDI